MITDSGVPASSFFEATFLITAFLAVVLVLGTFLVGMGSNGSQCCSNHGEIQIWQKIAITQMSPIDQTIVRVVGQLAR